MVLDRTSADRSSRRLPPVPTFTTNLMDVTDHLEDLQRSLEEWERDIPYYPLNRTPFEVETDVSYKLDSASDLDEVKEVLGTLIKLFKQSGILR